MPHYFTPRVFETGQYVEIHSTTDPLIDGSDAMVMGRYGEHDYILDLGFEVDGNRAIVLTRHCMRAINE
jgi:hypothetical protein